MNNKRNLSFWEMWNLSFGFFGVQIAYALQSANISRIFATLGADPHQLSFFWILPPLMGMIVQPLIGKYSDRTWNRLGRRMVNEEQKTKAYSIQSFLCNAGSLAGYLFPIFFTWIGIANEAPEGMIPPSVITSFYVGAAILILCVLFTFFKVKEMPPKEYAEFHGIDLQKQAETPKEGLFKLLVKAPKTFWTVGLVQFFCWAAFLYMWTYTNGTLAANCWGIDPNVPGATASPEYQAAGNWVGVVFAIQAVGSILWALLIPKFKNIKTAYVISLLIGAVGFISMMFIHDKYLACLAFLLIGTAWAAMLAIPFSLLTNALEGSPHMGSYLGLFNCTICLPQIVAAATGGLVIRLVGGSQAAMLALAGCFLILGALSVKLIKTK